MRSKICSVYNHGLLVEENVNFYIPRNKSIYLVLNKWLVHLPDSDKLTLEDKDGYRYKRILFNVKDHYVFEQI